MLILGTIASSLLQNVDNGVMDPLQVITVGPSAASSVTFTNIPSTYAHLQIRYLSRSTVPNDSTTLMRINSDTGNNYSKWWAEMETGFRR